MDRDSQVELVAKFFNSYTEESGMQGMLVDLYRAITCYRMYDSLEEFMQINPEMAEARSDIKELWSEFDKLSSQELAEVALELLEDM